MARKIEVQIVGDSSSLERAFSRAGRSSRQFSVGVGTLIKASAVFQGVRVATDAASSAIRAGISEWTEQAKVSAQTNAVLASTQRVANVTSSDVDQLADSVARYSGMDDEAVQSAENLLLTFKNVRNEVGAGNQIFDRATRAAADLSVAGFGSLSATSKQLGKALNDPVKGMTALGRAGVTFTKEQKAQIKSLVDSGNLLKAQKLILREVESQVGGSARAFGQTLPGQLARAKESIKNTFGDLVAVGVPAFARVVTAANDFIDRLGDAEGVRGKLAVVQSVIEQGFHVIVDRVRSVLDRVDVSDLGASLGSAIASGASRAADFLASVDWGNVGRVIVRGIGDFLKAVDWGAVMRGVFRFIVAAIKAAGSLLLGAAQELGGAVARALGNAIGRLRDWVKAKVLSVVLAIVEPLDFKILGHRVIPGIHQLVEGIKSELDDLQQKAVETGQVVAAALSPTPISEHAMQAIINNAGARGGGSASGGGGGGGGGGGTTPEKLTAAAKSAAAIPWLEYQLARAEATKTIADDLTVIRRIVSVLTARLRTVKTLAGRTELQQALNRFRDQEQAILQTIRDAKREARETAQFRALGLGPGGSELVPGVGALRKRLGKIAEAVKGTILDTPALRRRLQSIRKVLAGAFGKVGDDVRAAIKGIFDDIDRSLKDRSDKVALLFRKVSTAQLTAGLGLTPEQRRELKARLTRVGPGGTVPGGQRVDFAGAGGITINGGVHLHGVTNMRQLEEEMNKRARSRPQTRRGPR